MAIVLHAQRVPCLNSLVVQSINPDIVVERDIAGARFGAAGRSRLPVLLLVGGLRRPILPLETPAPDPRGRVVVGMPLQRIRLVLAHPATVTLGVLLAVLPLRIEPADEHP